MTDKERWLYEVLSIMDYEGNYELGCERGILRVIEHYDMCHDFYELYARDGDKEGHFLPEEIEDK